MTAGDAMFTSLCKELGADPGNITIMLMRADRCEELGDDTQALALRKRARVEKRMQALMRPDGDVNPHEWFRRYRKCGRVKNKWHYVVDGGGEGRLGYSIQMDPDVAFMQVSVRRTPERLHTTWWWYADEGWTVTGSSSYEQVNAALEHAARKIETERANREIW